MSTIKHDFIKELGRDLSVAEARAVLDTVLENHRKDIEKRNRAFNKLSGPKKRIAIAKDVLDQIEARRLVPKFGTYLAPVGSRVESEFDSYSESYDSDKQVCEVLAGETCQVCGIGSLFVAAVDRAANCTVGDLESSSDDAHMRDYLEKWFDRKQLTMIEAAFEGRYVEDTNLDWEESDELEQSDEIRDSIKFAKRSTSATSRLKRIMENIVANNGEFRP